ncbi:hypothetical protein ACPDHJ_00755 [Myroides sp. C8-3]|uniref:hypothetical protein n=1 Tax=Myroides sp. C8-3 TaxID=3400533 RepID=UPI003D2F5ACC
MKRKIKIQSALEQVLTYLDVTPVEEICFSSLESEIVEHFDYITFINSLFELSDVNSQLNIVVMLSKDTFEKMHAKTFTILKSYKSDLSEVSYLCKILTSKYNFLKNLDSLPLPVLEILSKSDRGDNDYFVKVLNLFIFKELMYLNNNLEMKNINISNCFGLLFLQDKKQAMNSFLNFVSKTMVSEEGKSNEQTFILIKDRFFSYLKLDWVPNISYSNYEQGVELFGRANMLVSRKKLEEIIGQVEFFQKKLPLHELSVEDMFSIQRDFPIEKKDYVIEVLNAFFELICEKNFYYKDINVFVLFFSSCTEVYPSYSKEELYYAYNLLNDLVLKDKINFYKILAVFVVLHNSDAIKLVPTKLPKILSTYFKGSSLSQSTIRQYISGKAEKSKEFLSVLNEVNDWVISIEKENKVNFQCVT